MTVLHIFMTSKYTYDDENGYKREKVPHSNLIHRQRAYKYIYLKYREHYPLPFSKYIVHHRDGNPKNNKIVNLQIMTPKEHEKLHGKSNGVALDKVDDKDKEELRRDPPHVVDKYIKPRGKDHYKKKNKFSF